MIRHITHMHHLGMAMLLGAVAAMGCGDNTIAADAAAGDASPVACAVTFSGNFDETSSGDADCGAVTSREALGVTLGFRIMSSTLAAPLTIAIDLGPTPSPGTYSPEVVQDWSAIVTSSINSGCVYSAGNDAVPNGAFVLTLDAFDVGARVAHGSLVLDEYVHALILNDCGSVPTEDVALVF